MSISKIFATTRRKTRAGPTRTVPAHASFDGTDNFAEELDAITVHPLDEEPDFHPRPGTVGTSYVEAMGKERAEEQLNHYRALGEQLSRPHQEEAEAHREEAEHETHLVEQHQKVVDQVWTKYHALLDVVGDAYVRRHPRERRWYQIRMGFLLLGDLVGVAGGAIILGEIPWLAVLQAMAAAVAAITSGLIASEIKDCRLARQRQRGVEDLPEEHKGFSHLFQGPDSGEYIVRLMVFGSMSIIILLGIGILMLRTSTEGTAAGVVFGMIAIAVAVASWTNVYHFTDELADKVEQAENHALRTNEHHKQLMALPARGIVAQADASARSIQKEYEELAWAAHRRVISMVHAWHAGRANIFGHGFLPESGPPAKEEVGEDVSPGTGKPIDLGKVPAPASSNGQQPDPEGRTA